LRRHTIRFPAIQLFLERAAASGARLDLGDADAAIVASICRKLGGVALAIELAAGRVESYGLQKTAALLDQRLSMLWPGQRPARLRQKTLHAALDWSYELLSDAERVVLRRLSIFVGDFSMEAALAVVTSAAVDHAVVLAAVDSLVAKSMLATRSFGAMMRYRLLDTTRAYALAIKVGDAELGDLAARHAIYYQRQLEETEAEWLTLSSAADRALVGIGNVRAALEWSNWSISHARSHSLAPYLAAAHGFEGELVIRQGDPASGVERLRDSMERLRAARYELLMTAFNISLVQGLAAIGRGAEAFASCCA
jgi:predicted ATPase